MRARTGRTAGTHEHVALVPGAARLALHDIIFAAGSGRIHSRIELDDSALRDVTHRNLEVEHAVLVSGNRPVRRLAGHIDDPQRKSLSINLRRTALQSRQRHNSHDQCRFDGCK